MTSTGTSLSLEQILEHVDERVGQIVEAKVGAFLWKLIGGLLLAAFGVAVTWGMLNERVNQAENNITALESSASVFLSRQDVEDLLGGRDQRLNNIEATLMRIEKKLDQL